MVLQAAPQQAVVCGYNTPDTVGQKVILTLVELNRTYTGFVGPDYKWSVKMDTIKAGGPYTLQAVSGEEQIGLKDVLFGDVWLCSGQSNMKFPVSQVPYFSLALT